jgi:Flp pilus assembly pilin Flp
VDKIFRFPIKIFRSQKGQGLIEYLIIVALMSVATIGIMRFLNQAVKAKFASSIYAIQGVKKQGRIESLSEDDYKKSDFSNFMNGASSRDSQSGGD